MVASTRVSQPAHRRVTDDQLVSWMNRLMAPWTTHPVRLHFLEDRMSDTSDAIAELNAETDNLAARIDGLIENVDDATAAELRLVSARLKGLAADPTNPVPPVEEPVEDDEQS